MVAERKVATDSNLSIEIPSLRNIEGEVICVPSGQAGTGLKVVRVNIRLIATVKHENETIKIPLSMVNLGFGGCIRSLEINQWPGLDCQPLYQALYSHPKIRKYCSLPLQNWLFEV